MGDYEFEHFLMVEATVTDSAGAVVGQIEGPLLVVRDANEDAVLVARFDGIQAG